MNPRLKCYLLLVAQVIAGLCVLGIGSLVEKVAGKAMPLLLLIAFVAINLAVARLLHIMPALREFWSMHMSYRFLPAMALGIAIAAAPAALALLFNAGSSSVQFTATLSPLAVAGTLCTVAWEELWFRSVILNYCSRWLSTLAISAVVGLTFMLVHALNPAISLLHEGPALFLAGFLLAFLYLRYRSIWVPLGVHFGNNITGSFMKLTKNSFFREDGPASAIVLAVVVAVFLWDYRRKNLRTGE